MELSMKWMDNVLKTYRMIPLFLLWQTVTLVPYMVHCPEIINREKHLQAVYYDMNVNMVMSTYCHRISVMITKIWIQNATASEIRWMIFTQWLGTLFYFDCLSWELAFQKPSTTESSKKWSRKFIRKYIQEKWNLYHIQSKYLLAE